MKKIGLLAIGIIIFLAVGVVATATTTIPEAVNKVVEEKGLDSKEIKNVSEVKFEDLPDEIDIKNIDKTNLAIYQVELPTEKMFVLSFGGEKAVPSESAEEFRQFLNFGFGGEMNESGFLDGVGGVAMSEDKGYVMMRDGSITGISTNLEVINGEDGEMIEIIIYKNGKAINFGNELSASDVQKDYDVQSTGVVTFAAGDTISVYAESSEGVSWKDVITMVEITTN